MAKRRSPLDSIKEIFSLLEGEPQNIQSVCNKLSFSWEQLENYLQLIGYIQAQTKLIDKKLGARSRILFLEQERKRE
ncbi:MAG: hypothetical protein E3J70_10765 [Candidatus Heimdallarchaeota archaeon]|nr:MAG: hypothetical protein E3J70_10765 [Candidatus Heimdallarchaeota archaeon]